jgi:ferritin
MITPSMESALNRHLNAEFYSSYLYLSMSAYAAHKGLKGAANWCNVQAQEEMLHVQKFYDYIESHGVRVVLDAIEKPPADFGTILELFEAVLKHEQLVTGLVNTLMTQAATESDHATQTFLQWFITEQVEEEQSVNDIIDRLKLGGDTGPALFMMDNELATRVLTTPAA